MAFEVLSGFGRWLGGTAQQERRVARRLYDGAVDQARDPAFFGEGGVEDSVEGRFDCVTLHVVTVLRRVRDEGEAAGRLPQRLFDVMFADMDASLRELGVGDLKVGKKVRELAEQFYGRAKAYEAAFLADDDGEMLAAAIGRNLFGDEEHSGARPLAEYTLTSLTTLRAQGFSELTAGRLRFATPPQLTGDLR